MDGKVSKERKRKTGKEEGYTQQTPSTLSSYEDSRGCLAKSQRSQISIVNTVSWSPTFLCLQITFESS